MKNWAGCLGIVFRIRWTQPFFIQRISCPQKAHSLYKISSVHVINPLIKNIILEQSSYPNKLTTD